MSVKHRKYIGGRTQADRPPATDVPADGAATAASTGAAQHAVLDISGMTCGSCAARVDRVLRRLPGVVTVRVNLATARADVDLDSGRTGVDTLLAAVERAGYAARVRPPESPAVAAPDEEDAIARGLRHRLLVAWPLTVAAAVLSMGWPHQVWARCTVAVLVTPVQFWAGLPFLRGAVDRARRGGTSMDTLVALGSLAAFGYSTVELLTAGGHVHDAPGRVDVRGHLHYDMAALIISFLLLGRWIEARGRRRASAAIRGLLDLAPGEARLVGDDGVERRVPLGSLRAGDLVRVRPGDRVPADGLVLQGSCTVDESMLTGEHLPVDRAAGDSVTGGTTVHGGALLVRLTAVGADTALARICRLVEEAQAHRAPVQRLADRVAGVFVPAVVGLGALTAAAWLVLRGDPVQAALSAIAVLVVACPCALGLATPVALMVGTGRAAAQGILIRSGEVLERSGRVDTVLLDKTGTLTSARMTVHEVVPLDAGEEELLRLAAAVESGSEHPVGAAVVAAARRRGLDVPAATGFAALAGLGARAVVDGRVVEVGRPRLVEPSRVTLAGAAGDAVARVEDGGRTAVVVVADRRVLGVLAVGDTLRPEAAECVAALRDLGLEVGMLTGDAAGPAGAVARQLGIERVVSGALPAEKAGEVVRLQESGRRVAMVGDGVNDAPCLAAAELGIAVAGGSDVAVDTAGITLLSTDLRGIPAAIRLARATHAVVVQNLGWAFGYNTVAIPLAAAGVLDPVVAGASMGLSSVAVVGNSLRLLRAGRSRREPRRGAPAVHRRRSLVVAWLAPALILGGAVGGAEVLSPARGQSLLAPAAAPTVVSTPLPGGGTLGTYADPATAGPNQLHLTFFTARGDELSVITVSVVALAPDGRRLPLQARRFGRGHFVAGTRLVPGVWRLHVDATTGDSRRLSVEARQAVAST
jgi:copper-transporting P-type ATPase V